jgi:hypothetical protein
MQADSKIMEWQTYTVNKILPANSGSAAGITAESILSGNSLQMEARNASVGLTFYRPELFHQASYLIFVQATHQSGLPVSFYADNEVRGRSEADTRLSKTNQQNVLVLPKTDNFFRGYGFHFVLKSVGTELARTRIDRLTYHPFPENWLQHIRFIGRNSAQQTDSAPENRYTEDNSVIRKLNPGLYIIEDNHTASHYIILSQAYDPGWRLYQPRNPVIDFLTLPFKKAVDTHIRINGWSNGWLIKAENQNTPRTYIAVYLPLCLQMSGIIITAGSFLYLAAIFTVSRIRRKSPHTHSLERVN